MNLNEKGLKELRKIHCNQVDVVHVQNVRANFSERQLNYRINDYAVMIAIYLFLSKTDFTCKDIADFYNVSVRSIQLQARKMNISLDRYEAQRRAALKRNYPEIMRKGKLKKARSIANSNREDAIRYMFYYYLKESTEYEVIVGINSPAQIGSHEMDIPIIIFNGKQYKKYVIEIDFFYYHEKIGRTLDKQAVFEGYEVIHMKMKNTLTNKQIEEKIKNICKHMVDAFA